MSLEPLPVVEGLDDCWNRIGVAGDRTCPELQVHVHCRNCPTFAEAARAFFDRPAPPGYLADWTRQLAREDESTGDDARRVLIFRLGGEWLALDVRALAEVTDVRPVHRIPHRTDDLLVGLVNIRGQLHPCASMHALLGVAPETDRPEDEAGGDRAAKGPSDGAARRAQPRLVVVQDGVESWAFEADEVLHVRTIPVAWLGVVPATVARAADSFSRALFERDGRTVGLLDEGRVLAALRSLRR